MPAAIPTTAPDRDFPNEYTEVERPLLEQLCIMGWEFQEGNLDYPQHTFREHFREVMLRGKLREAIRRVNRDDTGQPFLDDVTIERAIDELRRTTQHSLLAQNQELTEKLVTGVHVERAVPDEANRQRLQHVKFFEFDAEHLDRNEFLAINQFRVDFAGRVGFVIPDIVLFINGIPIGVVECKSPSIIEPMQAGINQLLRYSNNRAEVEEEEGVEDLFLFNQVMISTWYYEARLCALGGTYDHYSEWKDTSPVSNADVMRELGRTEGELHSQEMLAAGVLRPAHLLDIIRNFILFTDDNGKLIKLVARYQQFRAVHRAVHRLETGQTRLETGLDDHRGGVIWHTQGSGKSITMVFLVRKMRTAPYLRAFKVVAVTDRTSLEKQLKDTARLTGETIRPSNDDRRPNESATDRVKRILSEDGPDLVFCMIQKHGDREGEVEVLEYEIPLPPPRERLPEAEVGNGEHLAQRTVDQADEEAPAEPTRHVKKMRQVIRNGGEYPVLNESERIVLLIDECHRSQTKTFHANLMKALPNAAKIGFTGTPIMRNDATNTKSIFGPYIDQYPIQTAVEDEATVRILYEGRVPLGQVETAAALDAAARIEFAEYTEAEQQIIMQRFATEPHVLEAPRLVAAKARDMLRHYCLRIMPNGFKAQVVGSSRLAAVRYQGLLAAAKDELVAELEALDPRLLTLTEDQIHELDPDTQYLIAVYPSLERIRQLEFAAVISHDHNDAPSWREWSDKANREEYERLFKLPFEHEDPEKRSGLAFLCVQNMLLTGFDAPVEQVLYLDRRIVAHELLQAIARVNRKRPNKNCGYVVDYIGIADLLQEALEDVETEGGEGEGGLGGDGGIPEVRDEIPRLEDRHRRVMSVFHDHGIADIREVPRCVDLLADEQIRADFITKLRLFLVSLGIVLPRPEALPYMRDAKILGFIAKVAANLYRDNQLNLMGVEIKVRRLIDEYIAAQGIDPRIPPIEITDVGFDEHVNRAGSARARASEMQHAIRHHIRIHMNEDPQFFRSMSEKLEDILQSLRDNWDELERVLRQFVRDVAERGRLESIEGLDPRTQAPFFGILKEAFEQQTGEDLPADHPRFAELVTLTVDLVEHIQQEISTVDFWRDGMGREQLESWVFNAVRRSRFFQRGSELEIATRLVELARNRHRWLVS